MRRATTILLLLATLPVWAMTAQQILQRVEDTLTAPKDMSAVYQITVTDASGTSQTSTLNIWTLGTQRRMIKYTAPSTVKGIGFLVLSENEMYFYSPSRADVRRIAGHARYENFHNTDFSYQDLANYNYTDDYTAKLVETTDDSYVLELTPKSGSSTTYTKLKMWVNRSNWVFSRIDFYTSAGLTKRLTTGSVAVRNGYTSIGALLMRNLSTGNRTAISIVSVNYDSGLSSSFFSQRELQR